MTSLSQNSEVPKISYYDSLIEILFFFSFFFSFFFFFFYCPKNWIVFRYWEPYYFASVGFGNGEIRWWDEIEGEIRGESLKKYRVDYVLYQSGAFLVFHWFQVYTSITTFFFFFFVILLPVKRAMCMKLLDCKQLGTS